MESKAPVSRVCRASRRMWDGVVVVGMRALRVRSSRLAEERRELIFRGGDEEEVCNWERISESFVVDMTTSWGLNKGEFLWGKFRGSYVVRGLGWACISALRNS